MKFLIVIILIFVKMYISVSDQENQDPIESRSFYLHKTNIINQKSCNCSMNGSCSCCESVIILLTHASKKLCLNFIYQRNGLNINISLDSNILRTIITKDQKPMRICSSIPGVVFSKVCTKLLELNFSARSVTICPRFDITTKKEKWQITYTCINIPTERAMMAVGNMSQIGQQQPTQQMLMSQGQMGQKPMSQPGQMGQNPMSQSGQTGQKPMSQPDQMGQKPMSQPGQMGQKPMSQPSQMGQKPMSQPSQMGQKPMSQPGQTGQKPMSQPSQMGQKPMLYSGQMGQKPISQLGQVGQIPMLQGQMPMQQQGQMGQIPLSQSDQMGQIPMLQSGQMGQIPILQSGQMGQIPLSQSGQIGQIPMLQSGQMGQIPMLQSGQIGQIPILQSNQAGQIPFLQLGQIPIPRLKQIEQRPTIQGNMVLKNTRLAEIKEIQRLQMRTFFKDINNTQNNNILTEIKMQRDIKNENLREENDKKQQITSTNNSELRKRKFSSKTAKIINRNTLPFNFQGLNRNLQNHQVSTNPNIFHNLNVKMTSPTSAVYTTYPYLNMQPNTISMSMITNNIEFSTKPTKIYDRAVGFPDRIPPAIKKDFISNIESGFLKNVEVLETTEPQIPLDPYNKTIHLSNTGIIILT